MLRNGSESGVCVCIKTLNHREIFRISQKRTTHWKPRDIKCQNASHVGPGFLRLACQGGRFAPLPSPVSYPLCETGLVRELSPRKTRRFENVGADLQSSVSIRKRQHVLEKQSICICCGAFAALALMPLSPRVFRTSISARSSQLRKHHIRKNTAKLDKVEVL